MVRGKKMTLLFKPSLFILLALVTFYRDNMLPFFQDILCGSLRIRITEVGVGRGCESFPSIKQQNSNPESGSRECGNFTI
jgi:hypothetical protein